MIHPDLLEWLPAIRAFLKEVDLDNVEECWAKHDLDELPVRRLGDSIIVAPILAPQFCEVLLDYSRDIPFSTNMEEEPDYRINEWVLGPSDPYFLACLDAAAKAIWPLFNLMYGKAPNSFSSVQFARYGAPGPVGTGWHHDESSEATCTVSLNPGQFAGGGTALRPAGAFSEAVCVPPLPQGWGLLFNGRTTLHRGLPVTDGVRQLLVFWMNHIKEAK